MLASLDEAGREFIHLVFVFPPTIVGLGLKCETAMTFSHTSQHQVTSAVQSKTPPLVYHLARSSVLFKVKQAIALEMMNNLNDSPQIRKRDPHTPNSCPSRPAYVPLNPERKRRVIRTSGRRQGNFYDGRKGKIDCSPAKLPLKTESLMVSNPATL